jgi:hypothetical protein
MLGKGTLGIRLIVTPILAAMCLLSAAGPASGQGRHSEVVGPAIGGEPGIHEFVHEFESGAPSDRFMCSWESDGPLDFVLWEDEIDQVRFFGSESGTFEWTIHQGSEYTFEWTNDDPVRSVNVNYTWDYIGPHIGVEAPEEPPLERFLVIVVIVVVVVVLVVVAVAWYRLTRYPVSVQPPEAGPDAYGKAPYAGRPPVPSGAPHGEEHCWRCGSPRPAGSGTCPRCGAGPPG